MASGILPLAVGDATRLLAFLGAETKCYQAAMILGAASDTQDAWGAITPVNNRLVPEEELLQILPAFTGVILQIPPMFSAVHYQGQRLYDLARQGVEVEREPRPVEIFSLELLQLTRAEETQEARIRVACSRGTYVRTLCHDIGARLGTGAYMSELVRTRSGAFSLDTARNLEEIMDSAIEAKTLLLPVDYPLSDLPAVCLVDAGEIRTVRHGGSIPCSLPLVDSPVRIYSDQDTLIGIGQVTEGSRLKPVRVLAGSNEGSNT